MPKAFDDDLILRIGQKRVSPVRWLDSKNVMCRVLLESGNCLGYIYRQVPTALLEDHMEKVVEAIGTPPPETSIDYLEDMNIL